MKCFLIGIPDLSGSFALSPLQLLSLFLCQGNYVIKQHKNMADRLSAARRLVSLGAPARVVVDTIEDQALMSYAAFPDRLYILHDGRVAYEGGIGPWRYDLGELRRWLEAWKERRL